MKLKKLKTLKWKIQIEKMFKTKSIKKQTQEADKRAYKKVKMKIHLERTSIRE